VGVGQKWKEMVRPLSPVLTYFVDAPSTATFASGKRACAPNVLPVRRWQAMQWHMEMRTGSPSVVIERAPQLHSASSCGHAPVIRGMGGHAEGSWSNGLAASARFSTTPSPREYPFGRPRRE